jgi:integrase
MAVYKKGEIWHVQFQYNKKTYIKSSKSNKKSEALKLEAKMKEELRKAELFGTVKTITFSDALQSYLNKRKNLKSYDSLVAAGNKILKYFEDVDQLHEINTESVWEFDNNLQIEHGLATGTRMFYYSIIKGVVMMHEKLGYRTPKIERPEFGKLKQRNTIFTESEEQALYSALDPEKHKNSSNKKDVFLTLCLVKLLFQTSARYSEILALTWDQIDFDKKLIQLHRTKVDNTSYIAMTDTAYTVLKSMSESEHKNSTWLFPHKTKDGPRKHPSPAIRTAMDLIGCEGKTVHDIRRTVASRLVRSGMNLQGVQQVLGHSNITQTAKAYAWLDTQQVAEQMTDILNKF